jgi:hypothetical protein
VILSGGRAATAIRDHRTAPHVRVRPPALLPDRTVLEVDPEVAEGRLAGLEPGHAALRDVALVVGQYATASMLQSSQ